MSNVNVQGNNPNSQSVAPQYGAQHQSLGGTSQFTPGLSGTTTAALLEVMTDMMLISILYGEQMLKQVNAQKDMGEAINICDQKQGDAMFTQALEQGITGMAGGALTAGVGLYSMSSPPTGEIDAQITGAKSYQKLVNDPPPVNAEMSDLNEVRPIRADEEVENGITSRLKTLKEEPQFSKAGKAVNAEEEKVGDLSDKDMISLLHDDELASLKESIDTNVKDLTDQRQMIMKMHSEKATTYTTIANGFSTAAQGFGTSLSAPQQKDQKDLEGQAAVLQSALSIGQANSGQQRGGVDKFIGEVASLTQIIAAISNANALAS